MAQLIFIDSTKFWHKMCYYIKVVVYRYICTVSKKCVKNNPLLLDSGTALFFNNSYTKGQCSTCYSGFYSLWRQSLFTIIPFENKEIESFSLSVSYQTSWRRNITFMVLNGSLKRYALSAPTRTIVSNFLLNSRIFKIAYHQDNAEVYEVNSSADVDLVYHLLLSTLKTILLTDMQNIQYIFFQKLIGKNKMLRNAQTNVDHDLNSYQVLKICKVLIKNGIEVEILNSSQAKYFQRILKIDSFFSEIGLYAYNIRTNSFAKRKKPEILYRIYASK